MTVVNIHEAKTQFSKLIERTGQGEEIIIARAGEPVARLTPLTAHHRPVVRPPGALKGEIWIADDFDAPLPDDALAAFEGRT
ncbi:MAG: type II toxin-antitoxin system Phd/YefM family antitoxin [Burkholderiaceae bacterium]|nr:type II toxin-antitoxin system Phd/YefM family antitoxin [Burkholderiaceae bacterium]